MKTLYALLTAGLVSFVQAQSGDYFPTQVGNVWTFSYVSTATAVTPSAPRIRDSGTVRWEAGASYTINNMVTTYLRQAKSLVRRTSTTNSQNIIIVFYDSVFTPPRVTVDTLILRSGTGGGGTILFENDTCPIAKHDPGFGPWPVLLQTNDTSVMYSGAMIDGVKFWSCNCYKSFTWSFVAYDAIGPIEVYLDNCPGVIGASFHETRKLISRTYPTPVAAGRTANGASKTVFLSQSGDRIGCRLNLPVSSLVSVKLTDLQGRLVSSLINRQLPEGAYRYSWNIAALPHGAFVLRARSGTEHQRALVIW